MRKLRAGPLVSVARAHGTDDLTKAYRQICVRDHAYNVIAIWNPYARLVEFFVIRGLPFGSAAAVLQFNRYPQFISYFLNVCFAVCCTSYYDDYDIAEPVFSVHNAQFVLRRLHELCGFLLDKDKHVRASISSVPFLGIQTDFVDFMNMLLVQRCIGESRTAGVRTGARMASSAFSAARTNVGSVRPAKSL